MQNQHPSLGNSRHYSFVTQLSFKEIIQLHPEGMAIAIYHQESSWAVAPGQMQIFKSQRKTPLLPVLHWLPLWDSLISQRFTPAVLLEIQLL